MSEFENEINGNSWVIWLIW